MREAYKKQHCECGGELVQKEEFIYEISRKITSKGFLAKKEIIDSRCGNGVFYLKCLDCPSAYESDSDEQGRYIKGEKRF